ncbi:MAG TPA: mannonate dehydratase [Bacteroidales bacterium]|nr:mannonate dehydratase [Bacteroidales bacterium]
MALEKTWRWFGFKDPISLEYLVQMGVEGVVTSLHHISNGEVWEVDEIMKVKNAIESHGMRWSVVESLPVSEGIKTASADRAQLIANYQASLRNLGKCGIDIVVYNFMPVIDWVRTHLTYKLATGGESMYFDLPTFAAFDVFLLKRPNAGQNYSKGLLKKARGIAGRMTQEQADALVHNIIVVTQGFISGLIDGSVKDPKNVFLDHLSRYKEIDQNTLRQNMKAFLDDVVPVAGEAGINLCVHPDDPPYSVLGLPRIVSTYEDIKWILQAHESVHNGFAFCVGSLSARPDNDLPGIVNDFAGRIHFAHLRNTHLLPDGSFYESGHLDGSQNMAELVKLLLIEQRRRRAEGRKDVRMPFRPDHGIKMLTDYNHSYNPGYPLIGRLKGLAEIDGLMAGLEHYLNKT